LFGFLGMDGGEAFFGGGAGFSDPLHRRNGDALVVRRVAIGVLGEARQDRLDDGGERDSESSQDGFYFHLLRLVPYRLSSSQFAQDYFRDSAQLFKSQFITP
jgi:hypothetical protein